MQFATDIWDVENAAATLSCAIRPHIPPILVCAICWYGASALVYTLLDGTTSTFCLVLGIVSLVLAGMSVLASIKFRLNYITSIMLGIALGCACASFAGYRLGTQTEELLNREASYQVFSVVEDADSGAYGASCVCRESTSGAYVKVALPDEYGSIRYGEVFRARTSYSKAAENATSWYWSCGLAAYGKVQQLEVLEPQSILNPLLYVRNHVIDALSKSDALDETIMVANALLCGYRCGLSDSPVYQDFQVAGIAHMIAVSGAHLTLVCGVIAALFSRLGLKRRSLCLIELLTVGCYVIITAAPVSALRAAVMASTALLSFFVKRRKASLNALALSMIVLLLLNPQNSVSVSFLLSVTATFGIVVFLPLVSDWFLTWMPNVHASVRDSLALTLTASICTIPLSAAMFNRISFIAPLSNLVCAPLFLILCSAGCVLLFIVVLCPPLTAMCTSVVLICGAALRKLVALLASIPYACMAVSISFFMALTISALLCCALWLMWPKISQRCAAFCLAGTIMLLVAACVIAPLFTSTRIVMLDVGQGDAFLIQSEGETVLIDTGNEKNLILSGLAKQNVHRIQYLVISHPDDDHCGCIEDVCSVVSVEKILVHRGLSTCDCASCKSFMETAARLVGKQNIQTIEQGYAVKCGKWMLNAIWPKEFADKGGNGDSLCLLACADENNDGLIDCRALFCGDAEQEQLAQMVQSFDLYGIDILKVGHHGAKVALNEKLVAQIHPKLALISVGASNRYGHPAQATLEALENAGILVYRSDTFGAIECKLQSSKLFVSKLG